MAPVWSGYYFCNSKLGKLVQAQSLGVLIVAIFMIVIMDDNRFEIIERDNDTENDCNNDDRGDDDEIYYGQFDTENDGKNGNRGDDGESSCG